MSAFSCGDVRYDGQNSCVWALAVSASLVATTSLIKDVWRTDENMGYLEIGCRKVVVVIGLILFSPISLIEAALRLPFAAIGLLGLALNQCCDNCLGELPKVLVLAPYFSSMAGIPNIFALCCCAEEPQPQPSNTAGGGAPSGTPAGTEEPEVVTL